MIRDAAGGLHCQFTDCTHVVEATASSFEELVRLQTHLLRRHHVDLTLAETREERAAWERREEAEA